MSTQSNVPEITRNNCITSEPRARLGNNANQKIFPRLNLKSQMRQIKHEYEKIHRPSGTENSSQFGILDIES